MPPFDKAAEYDRLRAAGKTHEEAIAGAIQAEKAAQYDLLRSKGLDHAAALQHIEAAHSNAPAPTLEGGQVVAPTAPGKPVQGEAPGRFEHLAANVAHGFALTPEGIGATLANAGNDALLGLPGRFGPASLKDYLDQTSDASKQMGGVVGTIAPFVGATKVLGTGGGVLGRFLKGALAGNAVNAALATNKAPEGDRNAAALRAGLNPETALTAGTLNALPAIAENVRALRNGGHLTGELPDNILSPKSLWKSARSVRVETPLESGSQPALEGADLNNKVGTLMKEYRRGEAINAKRYGGPPTVAEPSPFTPDPMALDPNLNGPTAPTPGRSVTPTTSADVPGLKDWARQLTAKATEPGIERSIDPMLGGDFGPSVSPSPRPSAGPPNGPGVLRRALANARPATGGPDLAEPTPFTPPANLDALPIEKTAEMRPLSPPAPESDLSLAAHMAKVRAGLIEADRAATAPTALPSEGPLAKAMAEKAARNPPGDIHIEHAFNKMVQLRDAGDGPGLAQFLDGLPVGQRQRLIELVQSRRP